MKRYILLSVWCGLFLSAMNFGMQEETKSRCVANKPLVMEEIVQQYIKKQRLRRREQAFRREIINDFYNYCIGKLTEEKIIEKIKKELQNRFGYKPCDRDVVKEMIAVEWQYKQEPVESWMKMEAIRENKAYVPGKSISK